eukprot:gene24484-29593_t
MKASRLSGASCLWETLGKPRFIAAPMVDHSSLPWRVFLHQQGVHLCYSQMVNANSYLQSAAYRRELADWIDLPQELKDTPASKIVVQVAGDDPRKLVEVGKHIQETGGASAIDLNLGCPQKIAKRVTAKIRVFHNIQDTVDLVRDMEKVGVRMVTVHGRTREASKLFTGPADWEAIRRVAEAVSIPIIANGGVGSFQDVQRCLDRTKTKGVMSGEALLENPRLFDPHGDEDFRRHYVTSQLHLARQFAGLVDKYGVGHVVGAGGVGKSGEGALLEVKRGKAEILRGHLFKMLFRFIQAPANHDLRTLLAVGNYDQILSVIHILQERLHNLGIEIGDTSDIYPPDEDIVEKARHHEDIAIQAGLLSKITWYHRHRDDLNYDSGSENKVRILSAPRLRFSVTHHSLDKLRWHQKSSSNPSNTTQNNHTSLNSTNSSPNSDSSDCYNSSSDWHTRLSSERDGDDVCEKIRPEQRIEDRERKMRLDKLKEDLLEKRRARQQLQIQQ